MAARTPDKEEVTSILRSLIISSPERGKSIGDLKRDFLEQVGKPIPLFNYRTIEDFLRDTNEFIIENVRGILIVHVKAKLSSVHMVDLVNEQRNSKRGRTDSRFNKVRPLNCQSRPITGSGRQPSYSALPPSRITPRASPSIQFNFSELKKLQSNNNSSSQNMASKNGSNYQQPQNKTTVQQDLRMRLNEKRQTREVIDLTVDDSIVTKIPPIMTPPPSPKKPAAIPSYQQQGKAPTPANSSYQQQQKVPTPAIPSYQQQQKAPTPPIPTYQQQEKAPTSPNTNFQRPLLPNNPFFDPSQTVVHALHSYDVPSMTPSYAASVADKKKKSVNERLLQARTSAESTKPASDSSNENVKTPTEMPPLIKSQEPFQRKVSQTSLQTYQLDNYCKKNNLDSPVFKTFHANNRYQCHVTINNKRYSTYPTDYESEAEAIFETAKYAYECLVQIESQQKYPVCNDNEVDLMVKIYDCIKDSPTGVLSRNIPDKFRSAYQQTLPSNWMKLLAKYPNCFTIEDSVDDKIVFVVESAELDQKMDKLELPWDDEYWCLFISHTVSTDKVYGRLIGLENSTALDALITDIELDLIKNKQVATVFNVGQLYLATKYECSYRVRVEKVDDAEKKCFCYFVDEGDRQWLEMDELYVCHKKFMKFPPQAIRFSLSGLEDYKDNKLALRHLEDTLLSRQPFVGHIFTKKDDFIAQEKSDSVEAVIEVVLYDTSTDEDIKLNPIIEEKICSDVPHPKLLPCMTQVYVSHIADNGDIFCQLHENGLDYINKLIHKLTPPDQNDKLRILPNDDDKKSKLFLVFDEAKKKWCRVKFVSESKNRVAVFLVDYGNTKIVPMTEIYSLDKSGKELSMIPPQALQIRLCGFDVFPKDLVPKLREYFSEGCDAYVVVNKESVPGIVPEAKLYFLKDKCIFDVNYSINSEIERIRTESNVRTGSLLPKFQPPKVNDYFDLIVLHAATPSNFTVRPRRHMPKWVELMKTLQDYCKSSSETMHVDMIVEGEAYACFHTDGTWQRAIIIKNYAHSKFCAFYCDSGDKDQIDAGQIKALPEQFRGIPKLAITAKLSGIKPISFDWEMHDIIEFNRLVTGKEFQAIVVRIIEDKNDPNNNAELEIRLIDVSSDVDLCINEEFVKKGRAIYSFDR